jgi:hypothetical protein
MALEDQLLEDFRHLQPEQRDMVLDFIHFLRQKQTSQANIPESQGKAPEREGGNLSLSWREPEVLEKHAALPNDGLIASEPGGHDAGAKQAALSAYDLAERLGLIGILKDCPSDLSTNKAYFADYGK